MNVQYIQIHKLAKAHGRCANLGSSKVKRIVPARVWRVIHIFFVALVVSKNAISVTADVWIVVIHLQRVVQGLTRQR